MPGKTFKQYCTDDEAHQLTPCCIDKPSGCIQLKLAKKSPMPIVVSFDPSHPAMTYSSTQWKKQSEGSRVGSIVTLFTVVHRGDRIHVGGYYQTSNVLIEVVEGGESPGVMCWSALGLTDDKGTSGDQDHR